jgi:hypothetical protein
MRLLREALLLSIFAAPLGLSSAAHALCISCTWERTLSSGAKVTIGGKADLGAAGLGIGAGVAAGAATQGKTDEERRPQGRTVVGPHTNLPKEEQETEGDD